MSAVHVDESEEKGVDSSATVESQRTEWKVEQAADVAKYENIHQEGMAAVAQ